MQFFVAKNLPLPNCVGRCLPYSTYSIYYTCFTLYRYVLSSCASSTNIHVIIYIYKGSFKYYTYLAYYLVFTWYKQYIFHCLTRNMRPTCHRYFTHKRCINYNLTSAA